MLSLGKSEFDLLFSTLDLVRLILDSHCFDTTSIYAETFIVGLISHIPFVGTGLALEQTFLFQLSMVMCLRAYPF